MVATAGLALIASAYQFAFATGPVGFLPDYGPTTDTGDTTGSGPGGVGGGSVGRNVFIPGSSRSTEALIGAMAIGAFAECRPTLAPLPGDQSELTAVEVSTRSGVLEAGTTACFHLHGRSAKDGKWYDVTDRPETRIELAAVQSGLIRQQGSSHRFALPITASPRLNNGSAIVVGRFGGSPTLTAETTVTLHIAK